MQPAAVRYPRRNILAIGLLLIFTALALLALFQLVTRNSTDAQTSSYVTITGTPTCLPHRDTSGPVTMECAIGIVGDDGRYYALAGGSNNSVMDNTLGDRRVKVRGILKEPDSSSQYAVSGKIEVSSITKQ